MDLLVHIYEESRLLFRSSFTIAVLSAYGKVSVCREQLIIVCTSFIGQQGHFFF